jgi:hypothetical protein
VSGGKMSGKFGRRYFIKAGGLSLFSGGSLLHSKQIPKSVKEPDRLKRDRSAVKFTRDGLDMTPIEYFSPVV